MNEDSDWWTTAVAEMDTVTVRGWCIDGAASGALVDWCWWEGVQATAGWERARIEFAAFAEDVRDWD
ncbi:MAG: hypothetical protein ACT4QF_15005 [Sporichthyaceae bacterium]|jgi:hypothetical protein